MTEIKLREPVPNNIGPAKGLLHSGVTRFPGALHRSEIPMMENKKFITGLDKYDPSITRITDPAARTKRIAELVKIRTELEANLGVNLDQDTDDGHDYLSSLILDFNEIDRLNPADPEDKLTLTIINANLFAKEFPVARNKEEFGADVLNAKEYYIANVAEELTESVSKKLQKAKADSYLVEMYENDAVKMNKIAACILPPNVSITETTSKDYVYNKLDEFIKGGMNKENESKQKTVNDFMEAFKLSKDELDLRSTIIKSIKYNILAKNSQNKWNNRASGTIMGVELNEVYAYYRNPENQTEFGLGKTNDAVYSLKYQIKQKEII